VTADGSAAGHCADGPSGVLVVTGTSTEVGKTVVTAAIAALAVAANRRVAVVKAAQTGLASGESGDVDEVGRLSGAADLFEVARFPEPLAPATAAARAGLPAVQREKITAAVRDRADRDLVLLEGAGGLLVRLNEQGESLAEVAVDLAAPVLIVASAGLGTLNLVALTAEALRARGLECAGVVVGAWPTDPDLADRCNLDDLPLYANAPLLGVLPAGMSRLDRPEFLAAAHRGLAPALGGAFSIP
jgi:dethiobiotin synthetase